jgi:hypothetical protein
VSDQEFELALEFELSNQSRARSDFVPNHGPAQTLPPPQIPGQSRYSESQRLCDGCSRRAACLKVALLAGSGWRAGACRLCRAMRGGVVHGDET